MNEIDIREYRQAEKRHWDYYDLSPKETFVTLERLNIRVRLQEIGEGKPLLFVHGGPNAGTTWASIVAHLHHDYRCLILDRPGSGLSDPYDATGMGLRAFGTQMIASLLNALNLEKVAIVASSFGGALSLFFASAYPERVTSMVQQGCPAFVEGMQVPVFMRLLAIRPLGKFIAGQKSTEAISNMMLRQIGHGKSLEAGKLPEPMADWYLHLMNHTDTMRNEVVNIQHAASWRGVREGQSYGAEFLEKIHVPTLFIWGADDTFGGLDLGRWMASKMPGAQFEAVKDAGHLPWLDDPQSNARLVGSFLSNGHSDE